MKVKDMIFTVGKVDIYEPYILRDSHAAKDIGGSVWRKYQDALQYCTEGFLVYGVDADWEKDTKSVPGKSWRALTRTGHLIKLKHQHTSKENKKWLAGDGSKSAGNNSS